MKEDKVIVLERPKLTGPGRLIVPPAVSTEVAREVQASVEERLLEVDLGWSDLIDRISQRAPGAPTSLDVRAFVFHFVSMIQAFTPAIWIRDEAVLHARTAGIALVEYTDYSPRVEVSDTTMRALLLIDIAKQEMIKARLVCLIAIEQGAQK